jgi:hypothetical protein
MLRRREHKCAVADCPHPAMNDSALCALHRFDPWLEARKPLAASHKQPGSLARNRRLAR